ncbi:hypothetical protein NQ315_009848 [Exocentrus adspersus]|uniref:Deoxyribonuclease TATDN1 n=1 Tax=Exocentrus adspersus TaxID=1586481 RepID=A0AAV8WHR3_9CUCU|nr:hypothetical protein NQ315_009848 [Exocentrus adspersus]
MSKTSRIRRYIDIGANLTDVMYSGVYNGKKKHEPDLQHVLQRSWDAGLDKIILTGGNLEESEKALELAKTDDRLYATVGCHPTRCTEFEQAPEDYLEKLKNVIFRGGSKVVAVGECGLDYDRVQFCPQETQKKYFEYQLKLSETTQLPLFLHCRNAADDISLKTEQNLETVKHLPSDKILIETDCPWCEIKQSHAGYKFVSKENQSVLSVKKEKWMPNHMVKSRNEPCGIRQVLDVVSAVRNENPDDLCEKIYQNTANLFFPERGE